MSTKEKKAALVETMQRWQKLEHATVAQTAQIMTQTEHPVINLVMEVIQRDSTMHYRVQQLIIDSLTTTQINMPVDELTKVWGAIEEHIEMERRTIGLAQEAIGALAGTRNVVQQYLVNYLIADEEKHDKLLADLDLTKKGMYPG